MTSPTAQRWWVIKISGYGQFAFHGTEQEAEDMRSHKARWERGVGIKRRVTEANRLVKIELANAGDQRDREEER